MSGSSKNSFPPSNCQTISEFEITREYNIVDTTTRSTASSSGSTSNNGEVEICMKYDKTNLDPGTKLGISDDERMNKKLMEALISAFNYEDSYFNSNSHNRAPCSVNSTNNNNWVWKNITTNRNAKARLKENYKYANTIGIPPRTQSLCLGNLNKLNVNNIDDDLLDNSYLLMYWIIAAKLEGQKLAYQYKTNSDKKNLCKALGYSYADYGDLIKNTSIWGNSNTKQLDENLDTIFRKVFHDNIEQNGQTSDPDKYPNDLKLLREVWWNTNKKYILGALIIGAEPSAGEKGSSCVTEMRKSPPTTDYIPQFLRFAQEWVEHFCDQRKAYANDVVSACNACKNESDDYHKTSNVNTDNAPGKDCVFNNGSTKDTGKCTECKKKCNSYKNFHENTAVKDDENKTWRDRWKQMDTKYRELMKKAKKEIADDKEQRRKAPPQKSSIDSIPPYMTKCGDNNNECLKPHEDSFYQYLYENGISTLSSYINMVSTTDCGSDKPQWGKTTRGASGSDVYPEVFGSHPTGYKYACDCKIPSREELCRDNHMYNTRWKCGQTSGSSSAAAASPRRRRSAPSGQSTYDLCNLKHEENDEEHQTSTRSTSSAPPGVKNLSGEDLEFFNLFDLWYKDIQDKLDRHFHRISRDCKLENIETTSSGGSNTPSQECLDCRNSCECYKLWVKNITKQWQKQQSNYNTFVAKQQNGQTVPLNDYLFSRCWAEYFEKDLNSKSIMKIDPANDAYIIDLLSERCGDKKDKGKDKFQERIDKAEKETKICHKKQQRCKDGGKEPNCRVIDSDISGCKDKYYDGSMTGKNQVAAKNWDCKDQNTSTETKDVCVPPRTQTLCVANMYDGANITQGAFSDQNKMKDEIKRSIKKETERLYEYYKEGTAIITKKDETDKSGLPRNFCKAAERTYNDFKHMVLGDIPWDVDSFKKIGQEIGKKLSTNGGTATKEEREKWWDANSDDFWDAIRCGIKEKHSKVGGATGNECGPYPPEDNTDSQFVWWFKEWGQEFCVERKTLIDAITKNCDSSAGKRCPNNSGTQEKKLEKNCQEKCEKYQKFIKNKQSEWTKQKKKYEIENEGKKAKELLGLSYPECLGANFDLIFEEKETGKDNKSNGELKYDYGDAGDICSCKEQTYKCNNDGNISTCQEKKGDVTTWRTGLLKIGKDGKKLEGVYAPPRRQKLCLANLHPINFGNDNTKSNTGSDNEISRKKMELLNRLQMVAEREAYYLWLQHHTSGTTSTTAGSEDTNEDKKACCAIRRSFFDIGDIVKGTDLWDDPSKKYIDQTLKNIFEYEEKQRTKKTIYPNPILYLRKQWWEYSETGNSKIKDKVWDSMQCGVKNAITELKGEKKQVGDDKLPKCIQDIKNKRNVYLVATPQFVRWIKEWSQQFCDEYTTHMEKLKTHCDKNSGSNNQCNDSTGECKTACAKYNDWIISKKKEWNDMSKYYDTIIRMGKSSDQSPDGTDYHAITQPTAIKYLNQKCNKAINGTNNCCYCQNVGKMSNNDTPLEHMDKVVNKIDDKYKQYMSQCTKCYIQHIKDQIEKITNVVKGKEEQNGNARSSTGSINSNQSVKPAATDDICKNNGNIVNCKEVNDKGDIKVPIEPDNNDPKKNKEKNGNMNCGGIPSNASDIKWVGKDHYKWLSNLNPNIYVSPRRQKLCYKIDGSNSENDLKKQLLTAAANDAYNLGIKYNDYKNHYGVKPCKALKYSFNDYKHIILGTDYLEPTNQGTEQKLNKIFGKENASNGNPGSQQRKDWWKENKKCVWGIMVCGYNKGKEEANKINTNADIPDLTTKEGGGTNGECQIPDDKDNSDQFLSWLSEWYEDYCHIRKKLKSEVESSCKIEKGTFDCKKCDEKCDKYKDYMEKKEKEWKTQEKYYSDKKNGGNTGGKTNGYNSDSATEYLKTKFIDNCGANNGKSQSSSGAEVETNLELLDKSSYYGLDQQCTCDKYNNEEIYKDIVGQNNCKGLKKTAEDTKTGNGIKWDNSTGGLGYLNQRKVPKEVYLPPRKQKLCFQGFDGIGSGVNDKDALRKQLMKVSATEGYNLGQYYKAKNENSSDTKYSYDVEPCNALKYSFYDLRDIILGHDMTEPDNEGTEGHLQKIFNKNGSGGGTPDSQERKDFWTQNEKCVWNAMKCGYKSGRVTTESEKDLQNCDDIPSESDFPIGKNREDGMNLQFLRWFTEWGEDFCIKQGKELETLNKACASCDVSNGKTCGNNCSQCTEACKKYKEFINQWSPQYQNQRKKFEADKNNDKIKQAHTGIHTKKAYQFLNEKCINGSCSCMNTATSQNSGTDMPKSLDEYPDNEYKGKCDCTTTSQLSTAVPAGGHGSQAPSQPSTAVDNGQGPKAPNQGAQTAKGAVQPDTSPDQSPARRAEPLDPSSLPVIPSGNPGSSGGVSGGTGGSSAGGNSGSTDPKRQSNSSSSSNLNPPVPVPGGGFDGSSQPDVTPSSHGNTNTQDSNINGGSGGQKPDSIVPAGGSTGSEEGKASQPQKDDEFKDLDTCPLNERDTCNKYKTSSCGKKTFSNDLNNWNNNFVRDNKNSNKGVLVPPRRTKICFTNINMWRQHTSIKNENEFKKHLLDAASTEAKNLNTIYKENDESDKLLDAMKYSFADIGNIVKGDDLLDDDIRSRKVKEIFERIQKNKNKENGNYDHNINTEDITKMRQTWWKNNKKHVWYVMMCHYKGDEKTSHCDDYKTIDDIPQFLRWMTEWSRQFCEEKAKETLSLGKNCLDNDVGITQSGTNGGYKLNDTNCISSRTIYTEWLRSKRGQWKGWEEKYKNYEKEKADPSTPSVNSLHGTSQKGAEEYVKSKCNECDCKINNLENMYEQIKKSNINSIKTVIEQVHKDIPELKPPSRDDKIKSMNDFLQNVTTLAQTIEEKINAQASQLNQNKKQSKNSPGFRIITNLWNAIIDPVFNLADAAKDIIPEAVESGFKAGIGALGVISDMIPAAKSKIAKPEPDAGTSPQNNSTSDILTSTVPVSLSVALGSIALLFYMKKKPKIPTTKLFRVLEIPQNDYSIPDETSTNRYVPYGKYKGKTYIYVEGEETDDYIGDISSTDITSSESEYDEMDINDIYQPRSPKYKTLIDVVLKPSKITHDVQDDTHMYQKHNNNKLTDNEWNQLKENFISQYLENIQKYLPNEKAIDDNLSKVIKSNILPNNVDEKPFIIQIQDRNLHGDSEITYNIDWNIPKNITTNTATHNSLYSGIDLINDSLNPDQHIDIYDELIKRKENEIFGTKHPKTSSRTNSVSTKKHNDSLKSPNIFIS